MNYEDITKPILTEPGVKYFLNETLKRCHNIREKYNNMIFNISLFFLFIIIISLILIIKYKGKLNNYEIEQKNIEKQNYILEKIIKFQEAKRKAHQELITGLPHWNNDYTSKVIIPNI